MESELRTSVKELARRLGWWWASVVFSLISGGAGLIQQLVDSGVLPAVSDSPVIVPAWGWWLGSYAALVIGVIAAFHRLRVDRDRLLSQQLDLNSDLHVVSDQSSVYLDYQALTDTSGKRSLRLWAVVVQRVILTNRSEHKSMSLGVSISVPWADDAPQSGSLDLREGPLLNDYSAIGDAQWLESPIQLGKDSTSQSGRLAFGIPIGEYENDEELSHLRLREAILKFTDFGSGQTTERKLRDCVRP